MTALLQGVISILPLIQFHINKDTKMTDKKEKKDEKKVVNIKKSEYEGLNKAQIDHLERMKNLEE